MKVLPNGGLGDLSDFQRGQTDVAHSAKTATSLVAHGPAVSKVMTTYKSHGNTSTERNSGRKPKVSERDLHTLKRTVSKNH